MMKRKRGQRSRIIKLATLSILCGLILLLAWTMIRQQLALMNAVCKSPNCWEGITPGITSFEEAKTILEAKYGADNLDLSYGQAFIDWETSESNDLPQYGSVSIDKQGIVYDIKISGFAQPMTVSELIEEIGQPSHVWVARAFSSEYLCAGAMIMFSDAGILVSPDYRDNTGDSINIKPNQFVYGITFMTVEAAENWSITDTWKLDWQGYADYCSLVSG